MTDTSYIVNNTMTDNSYIVNNRMTDNSYIVNNIMTDNSYIVNKTMADSYYTVNNTSIISEDMFLLSSCLLSLINNMCICIMSSLNNHQFSINDCELIQYLCLLNPFNSARPTCLPDIHKLNGILTVNSNADCQFENIIKTCIPTMPVHAENCVTAMEIVLYTFLAILKRLLKYQLS